jgi:hypothetical protein
MKVTRALFLAQQIQAEVGGNVRTIQAKIAGFILMNPTATDDEVACFYAINA